ncbi:MAG: EamA family transporter, partial [Deltaproteobacteria bacterium]|nr:EamA family transporter [Deltaproteobacteria bacterium]
MVNWYVYSLIALLLLGGQRFLYKVAAERHCSSGITTAVFMLTVTCLSGAMLLWSGDQVLAVPTLFLLSFGNSSSFALATIANIESLKYLPAGISFPLTRLSLVVVVFAAVLMFDEQFTLSHWCGLVLACAVVVVTALDIRGKSRMSKPDRIGFLYIVVCILCGAMAAITSKLAAVMTSKAAFMFLSYAMGTLFSLAIEKKWGDFKQTNNMATTLVLGITMGAL